MATTLDTLRHDMYEKFLAELTPEQRVAFDAAPGDIKSRVEAVVEQRAIQESFRESKAFGRIALEGMWNVYRNAWFQTYLGEYNNILEWALDNLLLDEQGLELATEKHLKNLVFTVERIFAPVNAAQFNGEPFLTPDGEVITPEFLIHTPGIQEKMRLLSLDFTLATTHAGKQAILDQLFTETKATIEKRKQASQTKVFQWKRRDINDDTVEFVIRVPRNRANTVEALLNSKGEQSFGD